MIATTSMKRPNLVMLYDRVRVREYIKDRGSIFVTEEVVHTDKLGSTTTLSITGDKMPEEVYFNGERVLLTPRGNRI